MEKKKAFRLQSAMEYLMTYGWAILIIAVVLGALFALGVFNGNALTPKGCIASSGYICAHPVYNHANPNAGNVIITFGQQTGTTWTGINMIFANSTVTQSKVLASGIAGSGVGANTVAFCSGNCGINPSQLVAGQQVQVSLPATGAVNIGTPLSGYIWASYYVSGVSGVQTVQIATVSIGAT